MNLKKWTPSTLVTLGILTPLGVLVFVLPESISVRRMSASPPPDSIQLGGVVRDFRIDHPDFKITDGSEMGHHVGNVDGLGSDRRPVRIGGGKEVDQQWRDSSGNPIAPYELDDDGGLPGGHFDVDVFDGPSTSELYHKHEFDDTFDVTYVDVFNDSNLLFDSVVGMGYPQSLRLELLNPHSAAGTYTFKAGATTHTGNIQDGFTITFAPAALTILRADFTSLAGLRATSPSDVQEDSVDRNDSFAIRLFDTTTNALVYELAVYHHGDPIEGFAAGTMDACGVAIEDTAGALGDLGDGAIDSSGSFDEWFRDVPGTNLSFPHSVTLQRDASGVYELMTDSFYPADELGFGAESGIHNQYFTYSISASFTYDQCTAQFFEFAGNDDAWVFIDGKLAIDLGGVATPEGQHISLDRLGLTDGQSYDLDFFFAHRRPTFDSMFNMRTNIPMSSRQPTVSMGYD